MDAKKRLKKLWDDLKAKHSALLKAEHMAKCREKKQEKTRFMQNS